MPSGGTGDVVRTVVVGVGNPTLGDDSVGLVVAAEVAARMRRVNGPDIDVTVTQLAAGGLRLMEALAGFDRAVLVDALVSGESPPGTARELGLDALAATNNVDCAHDLSLPLALEMARMSGLRVPDEIRIFGVEAADVTTFQEALTPAVAAAVPGVVDQVVRAASEQEGRTGS